MPYQPGYVPAAYAQYSAYQQQQPIPHLQSQPYQAQRAPLSGPYMNPMPHQAGMVHQAPNPIPTSHHVSYASHFPPGPYGQQAPMPQLQGQPPSIGQPIQYPAQRYYHPQGMQPPPGQGYFQPSTALPVATDPAQATTPSQTAISQQQGQPPRTTYQGSATQPLPFQQQSNGPLPAEQRFSGQNHPATPATQRSETPGRPNQTPQSSQHRTASHVQIPLNRQPLPSSMDEMPQPREAKRRRSNEGKAVPVCVSPAPPNPSGMQQVNRPPPASSPLTELTSSQLPPTPPPATDYHAILLALSDEYVSAAYSMSGSLASTNELTKQLEEYHNMMSLGMSCLESALKNYRQPDARREARIRLRLASLLYEETENSMECEEVLSKGIQLCERSKLLDLKYAMHHLLARLTAKSSPKAAIKTVERLILDTEALRLVPWTYAFRFLRVSLSLEADLVDYSAVAKNLQALSDTSDCHRHPGVKIVASTMEAMVHLQYGGSDRLDLAQRPLAAVRTHQLSDESKGLPQIQALADCLDLSCAIMQFNPDLIAQKLPQMQANMDAAAKSPGWSKNGSFTVTLGVVASANLDDDSGGVLRSSKTGEASLSFSWLTPSQLYALGYFLSGLATMQKDALDPKAVSFLTEGLKLCRASTSSLPQSVGASRAGAGWRRELSIAVQLQQASAHCGRAEWGAASPIIADVKQKMAEGTDSADTMIRTEIEYLTAVCSHGQGDIESALEHYSSSLLVFRPESKEVSALRDTQAIATLDRILILRSAHKEQEAETLLESIEPYCLNHNNKALVSAYYVVKATADSGNSAIIRRKQYLQSAVQAAQAVKNNPLLCVILSSMTEMFFRGIVGEQATKSSQAARSLAYKTQNKLWISVTNRMYADTLELCGEHDKAAPVRHAAEQAIATSSPGLKRRMM
ncbi:hypothetical protein D0867_05224 [Hortaea werneckii]|uniref:Cohesin loading factor n=1 Tax=Hortaea werneckii TaxID=91943 RepID=A0A3M6ZTE2_HORWE|nr:hypothetical protein KC334_g679 [Hortaea werneckii]RMY18594.1 hypothetical protein D0867_05224 [Hortaea werneckii]RMY40735.1 hypothetical protein D0866_01084 [Hortaea werneckii]